MAGHKKNGGVDDSRVSVDREEYAAWKALKETFDDVSIERAKAVTRIHDLRVTCEAQAQRLIEAGLAAQHRDRINGLQRVYIDLLRADHPRVGSMEDLSEFWRQWCRCTENLLQTQPQQRGAVAELTPDLFRSWSLWVRDSSRYVRSFAVAGTRAEAEARQSTSQTELQVDVVNRLRETNATLAARVKELEGEVDAYKSANKARSGS